MLAKSYLTGSRDLKLTFVNVYEKSFDVIQSSSFLLEFLLIKSLQFLVHSSSRGSFASSRGKSISNEDLSPCTPNGPQQSQLGEKREPNGIVDTDDDFEPCEWRRISKLRRSLQLPSNSNSSIRNAYKFGSRPLDLPENLVSVSKIREELENGSRLDRAMRNNHVDLVALNNILKGVPESGA